MHVMHYMAEIKIHGYQITYAKKQMRRLLHKFA